MRKTFLLFTIYIAACNSQTEQVKNVKDTVITKPSSEINKGSVIYEYIYPDNTPDLTENHYIVLNENKGLYYGTSDEFEEGREGYLPGFFVTEMKDLKIQDGKITFSLDVPPGDFFTQPVKLKYKSSQEAKAAGYKNWYMNLEHGKHSYEGTFWGDTIIFPGSIPDFDKKFIMKK